MEVFTYQNVDALAGLFNAVAMVTSAGGYRGSLAIVTIFGFIAAFLAYAFAPHKMLGWHWLAMVTLVFAVLVVPKTRVTISDITAYQPPQVVDNVPFGLALVASSSTSVGSTMTELFETGFQAIPVAGLPPELRFGRNGLLFGNQVVDMLSNAVFPDAIFRTDFTNFVSNCVLPDLASGKINADAFSNSLNVWGMMSDTNPARFSTLMTGTGTAVASCDDAYQNLNGRLAAQQATLKGKIAEQLHPGMSAEQALEQIDAEFSATDAKYRLGIAAAGAGEALLQAAALNAIMDSTSIECARSGDTACVVLSQGRAAATAQSNQSWRNGSLMARQNLPMFRNIAEAICIAIFPIALLMLLIGSGAGAMKGTRNYLMIFVWIQFWAPLCAVLNYMMMLYAAHDAAAAAALTTVAAGKGLALSTQQQINASVLSTQAAVGYLMLSVPIIAWKIVSSLEGAGMAFAGGIADLQRSVATTAGEAARGNFSYGAVSMNQQALAGHRTSPNFSSEQNPADGASETRHADGTVMQRQAMLSKAGVDITRTFVMGTKEADAAGQAVHSAFQEVTTRSNRYADMVTEQISRNRSVGTSTSTGETHAYGAGATEGANANALVSISNKVARGANIGTSQAMRLTVGAAIFGSGAGAIGSTSESEEYAKARQYLTSEDLNNIRSYLKTFNKQTTATTGDSASTSTERSRSSALQRAYDEVLSASATLGQTEDYRKMVELHQGETFTVGYSPTTLSPALGMLLDPLARDGTMDTSAGLRSAAAAAHQSLPTKMPAMRPLSGTKVLTGDTRQDYERSSQGLTPRHGAAPLNNAVTPDLPRDTPLHSPATRLAAREIAESAAASSSTFVASRSEALATKITKEVETSLQDRRTAVEGEGLASGIDQRAELEAWRQRQNELENRTPTKALKNLGNYFKDLVTKGWPWSDDEPSDRNR